MIRTETSVIVRYYETDQMGLTHHSNYIRYFEVGRSHFMNEIGYPYGLMEEEGCLSPIMSITIRYVRPSYFDEELTIRTEVRELPEDFAVFYQDIYNSKGKLVAGGTVKVAFLDAATKKRAKAPTNLILASKKHWVE